MEETKPMSAPTPSVPPAPHPAGCTCGACQAKGCACGHSHRKCWLIAIIVGIVIFAIGHKVGSYSALMRMYYGARTAGTVMQNRGMMMPGSVDVRYEGQVVPPGMIR